MRKIALWLVVAVIAAWAALYGFAEMRAREYASRTWPAGLGRAFDVPRRFPAAEINADAMKLMTIASALDIDFRARRSGKKQPEISTYVQDELARRGVVIEAPPPVVARYLADHQTAIAAVRQHLLASTLQWQTRVDEGMEAPLPNLLAHMQLAKVLVTSALDRAHRGDAGAWDDLHAMWMLDGGLRSRPEIISQLISLAIAKMLNRATPKMPLPEPPWMREVRDFDYRDAMLKSWQSEAWMIFTFAEREKGIHWFLVRPYTRLSTADIVEHYRKLAEQFSRVTTCGFDAGAFARMPQNRIARWNKLGEIAMPNLFGAWQRLYRFHAELEATQRINQIRSGATPSLDSRCSEGKWLFENGRLRFSTKIPNATSTGTDLVLEYP